MTGVLGGGNGLKEIPEGRKHRACRKVSSDLSQNVG